MGTTIKGQMSLELKNGEVVIEFVKSNPMSMQGEAGKLSTVRVPLLEIEHIEFKRMSWLYWSNQIRIQFKSLETLRAFPRSFEGELRLSVPHGKRDLADDLVSAIKLARADRLLEEAERESSESH